MPAPSPETWSLGRVPSPIGTMLVVTDPEHRLRALDWEDYESRLTLLLRRHYGTAPALSEEPAPLAVRRSLEAYFAGDLAALDAIPVATGGTPFQRAVWAALREIAPGRTLSYSGLAQRIGRPAAIRAVGLANGANPVSVVVPCHRVIGSDSSLTGYGGGLARKRWLLEHEGAELPRRLPLKHQATGA
jgi:methylated-DNA-[protein]-cysteine S-methyltransferase